ncbi:LysM peptidoglycan-binding domain-containing protein [Eubacteriales bacterium OttesenSCG-928-K08]|nr:LysM peptidoglycan-binding domain-containing protein [Eubacteriales bacterium OttesenSCG-928-K08]
MPMKRAVSLALCCMLCLVAVGGVAIALQPADDNLIAGLDVSKWQGDIDFEKVRDAGIEAVYIRSSRGSSYIDPYFEQNYERARAAGLDVGFYHYVSATDVEEGVLEAQFFTSVISGKQAQLLPVMDYEDYSNVERTNEVGMAFLQEMQRLTGLKPVLYASASHARDQWSKEIADMTLLWVAHWGVSQPKDNDKWDSWAGWQYSSTGRVSGISGDVDMDWFTSALYISDDSIVDPDPDPIPDTCPDEEKHIIEVVVRRGDTLSALAKKYGTTVQEIVERNKITNPNKIYVGQMLMICVNHDEDLNQCYVFYTVKRGDKLGALAKEYGRTVEEIAALNNITNPNRIYVGQILKIPVHK